jgi:hypothetical protein
MDDLDHLAEPSYTGRFMSLWFAQILQVAKNEERDFIARAYDWPLGCCRARIMNWHTAFNH